MSGTERVGRPGGWVQRVPIRAGEKVENKIGFQTITREIYLYINVHAYAWSCFVVIPAGFLSLDLEYFLCHRQLHTHHMF